MENLYESNLKWQPKITNLKLPSNEFLPESAIAARLRTDLQAYINDSDSDDDDRNKKIDVISENICGKIIQAFERLYEKYICNENAIYMINISSRNRKNLQHLFDAYYYKQKQSDVNKKQRNKSSIKFSFVLSIGMSRSITFKNINNRKTFIKQYLKEYLKENINDTSEVELFTWLLGKILYSFDASFREIVFLMNDSYTRFKVRNKTLFEELCEQL